MSTHRSSSALRTLFVTTSFIGLAAGGALNAGMARADGTEVIDTTTGSVVIGPIGSTDYILVSNSDVSPGGITIVSNVGADAASSSGIAVVNGSLVADNLDGYSIQNTEGGEIYANVTGILVLDLDLAGA